MKNKKDLSFITDGPFIAHRGFHNKIHPENTLGAFKLGIENGFTVEMDLQVTKDEKLVVFHDDDMERLTGTKGRICDFTYEELLQFRILGSEEQIPLFSEVRDLVNGQVAMFIELKTNKDTNDRIVKYTLDALKDYKGKFIIMSFDPLLVKQVRKLDKNIIRGQLTDKMGPNSKQSKLVKWLFNTFNITLISKPDFIDAEFKYYPSALARKHKKMPVVCWTVRNKEEGLEALKRFDNITFETYDPRS